jgi:glutamine synthetase
MAMLERWEMELIEKIIPANLSAIRRVSKVYSETVTPYDEKLWDQINDIKRELGKDTEDSLCVFSQIKKSIADGAFAETSENQIKMNKLMKELAILYKTYNDNQIV